jgi:hypothetical protein
MANIISGIQSALRPMAKELIKGGLVAFDTLSEFAAEAGEQLKDLIAEAKAELAETDKKKKIAKDETSQSG